MVHSDETLGWRLSAVDVHNEASRLLTPHANQPFGEFPSSQDVSRRNSFLPQEKAARQ